MMSCVCLLSAKSSFFEFGCLGPPSQLYTSQRATIKKVVDPLLKSWLLRKPRIHTDALKSYDYLKNENTHYVINKARDGFSIKERTFWGHGIGIHVNHIESTWKQLRKHLSLRHAYRNQHRIQLCIAEFVYNWYKLNWYDLIKY